MTTLQELIDEVRQRINIEHATQFTDPELAKYANSSFAELHELVTSINQDYLVVNTSFSLDGSSDGYDLPADFAKMLLVSKQLSGDNYKTLTYISNLDENLYNTGGQTAFYILERYNVSTGVWKFRLSFKPGGATAGNYKVKYYPAAPLYALNDVIDYDSNFQYWTEFVILDVAIKCRVKDELPTNELELQRQRCIERIKRSATPVHVGSPQPIPRSTAPWYANRGNGWGYGGSNGFGGAGGVGW